ncbi:MAG: aminotransferase class I/II-fold pyridoxal phosphate-dependent enzyme [Candidatus Margulisbacteria bacterium]|nr:aminotransferase class I/II-fold pyridoxal phosphate-dependent enzyme [Candidatus Margulisiibacteriota bacterium]
MHKIIAETVFSSHAFLNYGDIQGDIDLRKIIHPSAPEQVIILPSSKTLRRNLQLLYGSHIPEISYQEVTSTNNSSLCIAIFQNPDIIRHLKLIAELTYSRVSVVDEHCIREPLEKKQVSININTLSPPVLTRECQRAFTSETTEASREIKINTTELDYGVNELPLPHFNTLFTEATMSQKTTNDLNPELTKNLSQEFNIPATKITIGLGTAPLFEALIATVKEQNPDITAVFPQGAYGEFINTVTMHRLPTKILQTSLDSLYKITPDHIQTIAETTHGPLLIYINAPFINPTAQAYSTEELKALKTKATTTGKNIIFIIDTIFQGLHFNSEEAQLDLSPFSERDFVLGGLSKRCSMGGLRFGWICGPVKELEGIEKITDAPSPLIQNIALGFYTQLNTRDPILMKQLEKQRSTLKKRADELTQVLEKNGWTVLPPKGGLFLVASPPDKDTDITRKLFERVNLRINSPQWTGLTQEAFCRWMLSTSESEYKKALKKINRFYADSAQ